MSHKWKRRQQKRDSKRKRMIVHGKNLKRIENDREMKAKYEKDGIINHE